MNDFSEEDIKKNCPHCNINSQAFNFILEKTKYFYIVCDGHCLIEGHILIIPKRHISCIAEYSKQEFNEFIKLNSKVSKFLLREYKSVSSFEHGVFGQTVFHSHIHYLPFDGKPFDIVNEGKSKLRKLGKLIELKNHFKKDGGYLFFSIGNNKWTVSIDIATPRFFRDRYAIALGRPERGNWKIMHLNKELMNKSNYENLQVMKKWKVFNS